MSGSVRVCRRGGPGLRRLFLERLEDRSLLATIVVTGIGDTIAVDGVVTLREAITAANTNAASGDAPAGDAGLDTINFNIAGSGVHTITPATALPPISDPVFINGYSQPKNDGSGTLASANTNGPGLGINAVPLIELDGSNAGGTRGLNITAGSSVVRGLVINRFQGSGILLASNGNVIAGNFIGTSAAGDADLGNGAHGVEIDNNIGPLVDASNNTIGGTAPADRNLISGNNGNGVIIIAFGQSSQINITITDTKVQGNLIGTDKAGTASIGNSGGINLQAFSGGQVTGNLIGGTTAAARNVISGNAGSAEISVSGAVAGNSIQGNFIGTDVTGTVGLSVTNGVNLSTSSSNNTIGGDDAADGVVDGIVGAANVISGHPGGGAGVLIDGGSSGNHVEGNRIGTNAAGTAAIPNGIGVLISGTGNFVGGAAPGAGNLISGSTGFFGIGVFLRSNSTNNVVQGNRIGTDATGANPLPNSSDGVVVIEGSNNNLIGGTGTGEGNVIAFNGQVNAQVGVQIGAGCTGNAVLGNSIFGNGRLGIDLGGGTEDAFGVTENDPPAANPTPCPTGQPDCDTGANNLQNFPVLTSAVTVGTTTTITGTLNSTTSSNFRIEFFSNTTADPSLHGEGQTFLGSINVMTDPNGDVLPTPFSFSPASPLATSLFISATATKLEDTDQNAQTPLVPTDTSEFSADVCVADQFTVVNTNDSGDGSLRQAILNANAHDNALNTGGVPDLVSFCILGSGVHTISPTSALPPISDPVIIDGYTQPGASANTMTVGNNAVLLIELNGTSGSGSAFTVNSPNNTFKGLVINRFPGAPFDVGYAFRLLSAGNTIQGNFLGTNPAGDTALPNRGGGVSVEATSQPANTPSGNNLIGGATAAARNLILGGLQDFAININGINAAVFQGGIIGGDGNTVQGNYIGTNAAGSAMLGRAGIQILTKNNIIGGTTVEARNVMFSFGGFGVNLSESNASGNTIQGNFIGINATGTASLGGNTDGITLLRAPNNTIGGTAAGAGNVISGNGGSGIGATDSDNLTIQGNHIGTNAAGTAAVPNGGFGLRFSGSNNTIGGTTPGARNIISANNAGIRLDVGSTTAGNLIQGNYIGTDITGTAALGNNNFGILIFAFQEPTGINTVGGTTPAARNIISANNGIGIDIRSANILVQGNYIGTDVNGTADLGNVTNGISIGDSNDTIGGTLPGAGNIIAFNGSNGVIVGGSATGNAILGNSIFSNGRLGLDLSCPQGQGGACENAFGVTANDPGDADTGGNNLQNFPVLTSASSAGGSTTITGTLNSTEDTSFRIEFFANVAPDPSGFGEGQIFLGAITTDLTDLNGNVSFTATLPVAVSPTQFITATATHQLETTSEFSQAIAVQAAAGCSLSVTTTGDVVNAADGVNSLREAIICANSTPGADTITVPAGTYTLTITGTGENSAATGDLDITDDLTINGAGAATTIIQAGTSSANAIDRVLDIIGAIPVNISGVTIRNGNAGTAFDGGGGIHLTSTSNTAYTVTITDSTISNNMAVNGGGINNDATQNNSLVLVRTTVSNNTVTGDGGGIVHGPNGAGSLTLTDSIVRDNIAGGEDGGILAAAAVASDLTITGSTISGNSAQQFGGGINWFGSTFTLTGSTVSGNTAGTDVGGIAIGGSTTTITNSTISGNMAARDAGGIGNFGGPVTLTNVTIANNTADSDNNGTGNGGGLFNLTGKVVNLKNTILAGNTDRGGQAPDASGTLNSLGHNLIQNTSGATIAGDTATNITGQSANLGPLASNGGLTQTHALLAGSPAINAGDDAVLNPPLSLTTDQRGAGFPRSFGSHVDIGAFESQQATAPQADLSITKGDSPDPVTAGSNLTYTITVTNAGPGDAQGVSLADAVPANTTFVSFTAPAGWSKTTPAVGGTGTITSTRTTLAAGSGPQTFTLVVKANASAANGSTISNTATVASTTDTNSENNSATQTTTVATSADLSVTKIDRPDPVAAGANLAYTIVVQNSGLSDAQSVGLSDLIPANTTFVSATQTAGPAFTLAKPPVGGTGTFTATIGTLAAGASATFTLVVQVDGAASVGSEISNTATVASITSDANADNNTATASSDVAEPGVLACEVTTLNSPGNPGTATLGDDADDPGHTVLIVTGTSGNDVLIIEPRPSNLTQVRVKNTGKLLGIFHSSSFQHIVAFGLAGNDTIVVNALISQPATLLGGGGNDYLYGGSGNDALDGGDGNDHLFGGWGNDTLCGGNGNDYVYGQNGNDTVGGDAGNDHVFGEAGDDLVLGGEGNDFLYGGIGNDQVFGQAGNDQLFGDAGNDIVVGGDGNDKLFGSAGRDLLIGGAGADQLFGETHDDILVAGSTVHDADQQALLGILAEWTSNHSYATRVANIRNGGGANGGFTLDDGTVIDDGLMDILRGDGGQDWFLIGTGDKVKDRAGNELLN